jgi:hypothetical protein
MTLLQLDAIGPHWRQIFCELRLRRDVVLRNFAADQRLRRRFLHESPHTIDNLACPHPTMNRSACRISSQFGGWVRSQDNAALA